MFFFEDLLSALDKKLRADLQWELKALHERLGVTFVYVTHDQKEAMSVADRLAILRSGTVEQIDPPAAAYYSPHSEFVADFLGETNIIEGTVAQENGVFHVETQVGSLPLPHGRYAIGEIVRCSIRPESWTLVSSDSRLSIQGTVQSTTFLGESTQVIASVGGRTILAMVHGRKGVLTVPAEGSPIALTAQPEEIAVIPS